MNVNFVSISFNADGSEPLVDRDFIPPSVAVDKLKVYMKDDRVTVIKLPNNGYRAMWYSTILKLVRRVTYLGD